MTEREKWAVIFEEAAAMLDNPESVPEAVRRNYAERLRNAALRAPASEGEAVAWVPRVISGEHKGHLYLQYAGRSGKEMNTFVERERNLHPHYQHLPEPCEAVPLFTHPAPATVTEAMVEAGAKALVVGVNGLTEKGWENKDGDSWIEAVKAQAKKEMREVLLAALGGAR